MLKQKQELHLSPLGKDTSYISHYQPDLLFPIPRQAQRKELGINSEALPFEGEDMWTAFEISWLNPKGKPIAAVGEFIFPHHSPCLLESKSFKLYLNSLNNTKFESFDAVTDILKKDLSQATGAEADVKLIPLEEVDKRISKFSGICLDDLDVDCYVYTPNPAFLSAESTIVTEALYTDLFKSNCPVTGQPDWASVQISYTGRKIRRNSLLQYLVSYREHNGFHEDCVERIFTDISATCQPEQLLVYARYTRRGGLDINPYRSSHALKLPNNRLHRQ